MRKLILLRGILGAFIFSPLYLIAQNIPSPPDASFKVAIAQPSPEAASLGRYGEYPVTLNNGLVNISIPLYEIKTGKLSLPITLSYHGGGVKAYDIASSVGLGWSLNAGGTITRAIMGKPDESTVGVLNKPFPSSTTIGQHFQCFISLLARPFAAFDGQADKFYYNLGGSNGKFIFKNIKATGTPWEIVTIPYSPIKISVSPDFQTFTIIDLDGTTYVFGQVETTRVDADGYFYSEGPTSWFLTSIISADKSDTITITYTAPIQVRTVQGSNTLTVRDDYGYNLTSRISESRSATVNVTNSVNVNEIIFNNGKLSFDYASREDLSGKRLIAINIFQRKNGQYIQIKQFNFSQTYFTATPGQITQVENLGFIFDKRLRLDNVYEQGFENGLPSTAKPPYSFEYDAGGFPLYGSTAQDLMGFYNGKHSNENLLFYGVGNTDSGPVLSMEYGADRTTNPTVMKGGSLKKMTFPTGGFTIFENEPNQVTYTHTEVVDAYDIYAYSLISHDPNNNEITFTVTPETTGGANSVTAEFKVNLINNFSGSPKISTTVQLFDVTGNDEATFDDSNTDAMFDLPSTYDEFHETRNVKLLVNHTYKLWYDDTFLPNETANFIFTEVKWKVFTGYEEITSQKTDYNGGLRIRSITSNDGSGNTVKKTYTYPKWYYNSNLFSGDISSMANFLKTRTLRYWNGTSIPMNGQHKWYDSYGENPTFQIGSSANMVVSYEEVEEYTVDPQGNPLGKTIYTFNKAQDGIPSIAPFFRTDEEWKRSQLAKQKIFKSVPGGKFVLVEEIINAYNYTQMDAVKSYYATLELDFTSDIMEPQIKECPQTLTNNVYKWMDLSQFVYKSDLISSTTIRYDDNGLNPQTTRTEYFYDNGKHKQLIRTIKETSNSRKLENALKYPLDYSLSNCNGDICSTNYNNSLSSLLLQKETCETNYFSEFSSYADQDSPQANAAFNNYLACGEIYQDQVTDTVLPDFNSCKNDYVACLNAAILSANDRDKSLMMMQRDNVVSKVVESTSGFILNDTEYITGAVKTDFKPIANGATGPDITWTLDTQNLISKATFGENPSAYYRKIGRTEKYDDSNNVIQRARENNITSSFIWDYNKEYPIAEVSNAASDDIAHTSFEADGSGNLIIGSSGRINTDSRTGTQSYSLSAGNISRSGLIPNKKYTINLWAKSGSLFLNGTGLVPTSSTAINGWQYYQTTLTASASVTTATFSGNALIDELRVFPHDAQMTTYTFDPKVGMTSRTDINNNTTFYEYDPLNRLFLIRDNERNIIKRITYQFKLD